MKQICKSLFIAFLLAAALFSLTSCGKQKIDLKEYVEISFYGANGYGSAYATLEDELLLTAIGLDPDSDENWSKALQAAILLEEVDVELSSVKDLSNGDEITVTVTYPDSLAENLDARMSPKSGSSWTVSVSGLTEVEQYDLFSDLSVAFLGYNGYGSIEVSNIGGHDFRYTISQEEKLSNGNVVTITLESYNNMPLQEYCIDRYSFIPVKNTMEYTVSGLEEAPQIDLFEDIDITVEGYSPYLSLSIFGKYENDGIIYELTEDVNGTLAIGDTVTIRATYDDWFGLDSIEEHCLEKLDALPASDTYTFTIPENTPYFITEADQLTEDILSQLIAEAKDQFDSADKADELSIQGVRYHGYYLQTAKRYDGRGECCCISIVHEVEYTSEDEHDVHYNVIIFHNPYVDENGIFRFEEVSCPYSWDWYDRGVEDLYDFEKEYITAYAADYKSVQGK